MIGLVAACGGKKTKDAANAQEPKEETTRSEVADASSDKIDYSRPFNNDRADCIPLGQSTDNSQREAIEVKELSELYSQNCAACHGSDGSGSGAFPDIRDTSFESLIFSVRNGRSGVMPAFSEDKYPREILKKDFVALTGKQIDRNEVSRCSPDLVGDNDQAAPELSYRDIEQGPQAGGLGFGLDAFVMPYVMCKEIAHRDDPSKVKKFAQTSVFLAVPKKATIIQNLVSVKISERRGLTPLSLSLTEAHEPIRASDLKTRNLLKSSSG